MLEIEIFSDVVCPWCFIGKRRLDEALASDLGQDTTLRWRPYQLHPNIAAEGVDRRDYLQRRYGENADPARVPGRIDEEAKAEGLELRFDKIERMPNTLLAHRLLEFAFPYGLQHELSEALFVAYFCAGRDIGESAVLVAIAAEVGLSGPLADSYLQGDDGLEEVIEQLARAVDVGVSGVPGYYLANGFLLPGAQTSETMGQIIRRVKTKLAGLG
jgi:predicted DsbA family dithiol-disulfide isomerase